MHESILRQVPNPCKLKRIFKQATFGKRIKCPVCGCFYVKTLKDEERWRCKRCRSPFSIKSASWLKGSKLPLQKIWLIIWCWQKKKDINTCMDFAGVSRVSALVWYEKLRDHIPQEKLDILLKNDVVCDEMYTRGASIIGAKQKGTRNIVLRTIFEKSIDRKQALEFLTSFVKCNSNLFTDGASIYKGINKWHKINHMYEIHSKFEFSLTSEIEGLWGVLRTFIRRMYHHVTKYKIAKVVAEFCLRFRRDKIFENPQSYLSICLSTNPFAL